MTVLVKRSTPGHRHAGHARRATVAAMIALAATASLFLLNETPLTPAWLNWAATGIALTAVLAVLMAALVGWQGVVTAAVDDGVVAPEPDRAARNARR